MARQTTQAPYDTAQAQDLFATELVISGWCSTRPLHPAAPLPRLVSYRFHEARPPAPILPTSAGSCPVVVRPHAPSPWADACHQQVYSASSQCELKACARRPNAPQIALPFAHAPTARPGSDTRDLCVRPLSLRTLSPPKAFARRKGAARPRRPSARPMRDSWAPPLRVARSLRPSPCRYSERPRRRARSLR